MADAAEHLERTTTDKEDGHFQDSNGDLMVIFFKKFKCCHYDLVVTYIVFCQIVQQCEMFLSIVEKIHMFSQPCCTIRSMRPIYRILGNSNSNYFLLMMVLEELWNWYVNIKLVWWLACFNSSLTSDMIFFIPRIIIIHIWSSLLVHERRCHQCWSISIVNGGILAWHVEI